MQTNSSNFRDFTRGGQIIFHAIHMFWQVLKRGLMISSVLLLGLWVSLFLYKTSHYDRYILEQIVMAHLKLALHDNKVKHTVEEPTGRVVELRAVDFIHSLPVKQHLNHCYQAFWSSLWQAIAIVLSFLGLFLGYFIWQGKVHNQTKALTGQDRVEPSLLHKLLKKKKSTSEFSLAGVPLVQNSEVQHILLAGTTGTGKSVAMQELMDQVRAKGQRAIVYDIEEDFIPYYYRPKVDILLNPLDQRAPAWNIWQECRDLADFETAALSLMPEHLAGVDPFWVSSARSIFACAALKLQMQNQAKTKHLLEPIFAENLQALSALVAGTPAARLVAEQIEKTALCIAATLSTYCRSLMYLKDEEKKALFSIRRWIEADKGDSWLFIASNELKLDALKPLLSIWLDVASKTILSLSSSRERRLWFFVDELTSLHKLPSLKKVLTRGRKYGACFVAAIPDIHDLYGVYGKNDAESLTALFNTKVFYRTQEPNSAAWMSKVMGQLEVLENKEGFSYGAHEMRDGVSIHEERRRESVVKETEFLELDNLMAFLRLPGNWPVTKLAFNYKARERLQPAFLPRDLSRLLFTNETKKGSNTHEQPTHGNATPLQGSDIIIPTNAVLGNQSFKSEPVAKEKISVKKENVITEL